jgi:hypothetical protein
MKNLILTIALVLSTLISLGQTKKLKKIIVEARVGQNINWPSNLTLNEAKQYNLVEYPNYTISTDIYTFDLVNKKCYKEFPDRIVEFKILSYKKNQFGYYFELYIPGSLIPNKIALTEKEEGGYVFIVQYSSNPTDERLEGYFTDQRDLTINFEY